MKWALGNQKDILENNYKGGRKKNDFFRTKRKKYSVCPEKVFIIKFFSIVTPSLSKSEL